MTHGDTWKHSPFGDCRENVCKETEHKNREGVNWHKHVFYTIALNDKVHLQKLVVPKFLALRTTCLMTLEQDPPTFPEI